MNDVKAYTVMGDNWNFLVAFTDVFRVASEAEAKHRVIATAKRYTYVYCINYYFLVGEHNV